MFRQWLVVCLAAGVLSAQPSPEKTTTGGIDRADVQNLIDRARTAPPEFAADVLITLVESGLVPDHRLRRNLLDEAFSIAGSAQEKIALKRGSGDSPVTSALHGAFRKGIDQASLRSRAVEAMLQLDVHLARQMFERIDLPIDPTYGCEQQTVPDFTAYYVAMFDVARNIPDHAQLEIFLASHMPKLRSTAQITPLARVFMQIRSIEHMPAVINAFSSRLPDLMVDRRVFSSYYDETMEAIGQLVTSAAPSTRERLIQRSRDWAVRNISYGICAEPMKYSVGFDGSRRAVAPTDPTSRFNQEVAWHGHNARIEATANLGPVAPSTGNSNEYIDFFRTHLLLAKDDEGALDASRWRSETENYIARLSAWSWTAAHVESSVVMYRNVDETDPRSLEYANEPRPEGAVKVSATPFEAQPSENVKSESLDVSAAVSEARPSGSAFREARPLASAFRELQLLASAPNDPRTVTPVVQASVTQAPGERPAADFFLEKSDLLTQVLFLEHHARAAATSGPVKINWSGARKPEGPRLDIPGRDRAITALLDLFNSEAAKEVFEQRRVLWFSPVRDLLAQRGMPSLYAASNHPILRLYGRLAELISLR